MYFIRRKPAYYTPHGTFSNTADALGFLSVDRAEKFLEQTLDSDPDLEIVSDFEAIALESTELERKLV